MTSPTRYSSMLGARSRIGKSVGFEITEDWLQGRTAYGGLLASLAVCAMRDIIGGDRRLRSLHVSFVRPVPAGPITVEVEVVRGGRTITQVKASAIREGHTACLVLGVFGISRESRLSPISPQQEAIDPPDGFQQMPFISGVTPNCTQHFAFRWAEGDIPFSAGKMHHSRIYLKLKDEPINQELLTVLLADAIPPPVLGLLRRPVSSSSVSWGLECLPFDESFAADGWWRTDTHLTAVGEGYAHQNSTLWTPGGDPASIGHQVVAVYE